MACNLVYLRLTDLEPKLIDFLAFIKCLQLVSFGGGFTTRTMLQYGIVVECWNAMVEHPRKWYNHVKPWYNIVSCTDPFRKIEKGSRDRATGIQSARNHVLMFVCAVKLEVCAFAWLV